MNLIVCSDKKKKLIAEFPLEKLRYETMTHNKVYNYNVAIAIPEGMRSYIWIRQINVVYLIHIDNFGNIKDIFLLPNVFINDIQLIGVILYGTHILYNESNHFVCHDVKLSATGVQDGLYISRLEYLIWVFQHICANKEFKLNVAQMTINFKDLVEYINITKYAVRYFVMVSSESAESDTIINMISLHSGQVHFKPIQNTNHIVTNTNNRNRYIQIGIAHV